MTEIESDTWSYGDAEGSIAKHEINGNTYLVAVYHETFDRYSHAVIVFADPSTGEDHGFYDHPNTAAIRSGYDIVVREKVSMWDDESVSETTVRAINEAVCIVENKQDERQKYLDLVESALEANAEVHGGIDYVLDS